MTPETIYRVWRGDVNRWHHNPDWRLRESGDTIHRHQWGVAFLLMQIFPDYTHAEMAEALTHDVPESWTGDPSYLAKMNHGIREAHDGAETARLRYLGLPSNTSDRVKLCDGVECILWAADHGADMTTDGWPEHIAAVKGEAWQLCADPAVEAILSQAGVE